MSDEPPTNIRPTGTDAAGTTASASPGGRMNATVLFHPLCAQRLQTSIRSNIEALTVASQQAIRCIEESIALSTQNSPASQSADDDALKATLRQALQRLKATARAADSLTLVSKEDPVSLVGGVSRFLNTVFKVTQAR